VARGTRLHEHGHEGLVRPGNPCAVEQRHKQRHDDAPGARCRRPRSATMGNSHYCEPTTFPGTYHPAPSLALSFNPYSQPVSDA
jgi:hypothetical protein